MKFFPENSNLNLKQLVTKKNKPSLTSMFITLIIKVEPKTLHNFLFSLGTPKELKKDKTTVSEN